MQLPHPRHTLKGLFSRQCE